MDRITTTSTVFLPTGSRIVALEPSIMGMVSITGKDGGQLAIASEDPDVLWELAHALDKAATDLAARRAARA